MKIKELFSKRQLTYVKKQSIYCKVIYNYLNLIFTDTDGEQYGSFKSDTINVPLEYTKDTTYSNAPYRAKVTDLVVTLEEEEQNNEEEKDNE